MLLVRTPEEAFSARALKGSLGTVKCVPKCVLKKPYQRIWLFLWKMRRLKTRVASIQRDAKLDHPSFLRTALIDKWVRYNPENYNYIIFSNIQAELHMWRDWMLVDIGAFVYVSNRLSFPASRDCSKLPLFPFLNINKGFFWAFSGKISKLKHWEDDRDSKLNQIKFKVKFRSPSQIPEEWRLLLTFG